MRSTVCKYQLHANLNYRQIPYDITVIRAAFVAYKSHCERCIAQTNSASTSSKTPETPQRPHFHDVEQHLHHMHKAMRACHRAQLINSLHVSGRHIRRRPTPAAADPFPHRKRTPARRRLSAAHHPRTKVGHHSRCMSFLQECLPRLGVRQSRAALVGR